MVQFRRCMPLFALFAILVATLTAQDKPENDSADKDYAAELPRIPPKSPAEAMSTFQIAKGFRLEQVAAEPLLADSVAIEFDEDGRLYTVEMRGYSEEDAENLSQIRLLTDTDGDGKFDQSSIFADGLSWPTAVHCYDGGIFVADAPNIYFLKDTDHDNRADVKRVVFTGFGKSNVQGLVNSFHWGLDNRIHGATSSSGADVFSEPKKEGDKPLVLRGRDFAFDPRTLVMSAVSGGAQHGMSFNQWGEKFVCSNSDHIQHIVFEDRYIARNPYFAAPSPRKSIAVDGPQAEVFRTSPVEPWRIVRTRLRIKKIVPGVVEGDGRAAGYFTGATGVTIYRGNAWPQEFAGLAIVGDVGSNLAHRKRLEPDGVTYKALRVDEKSELLTSSDIWFRPCQFANAPDGTLYVLDMYREVIEHPASLPPPIKKHLDLTSGRDRGRLYRVVPEGFKQPPLPRLGQASTAELVKLLASDNGWHRDTAARLLYQKQDRSALGLLDKLIFEAKLPEGRIAALYALDGMRGLTVESLLRSLDDKHPRVREHAVRLSEQLVTESSMLRDKLFTLVNDEALRVRYQLAFSLGELPSSPQRNTALATIAKRDGSDGYVRAAVMSSLVEGAGQVLTDLVNDTAFRQSSAAGPWLAALAGQIGKQQRADDVAAILNVLRVAAQNDKATVQSLVRGLAVKSGSPLEKQIAAATKGQAEEFMKQMLQSAAEQAQLDKSPVAKRVDAIHLLRLGDFASRRELFAGLLQPTQPAEIQAAALNTLASFSDRAVAELMIGAWGTLSPRLRGTAADVLASRDVWLRPLLEAVTKGQVAANDLDPSRIKQWTGHSDAQISALATEIAKKNQLGNRAEVLAEYRETLNMPGDVARGKQVFTKICAACHQFGGVGHAIGPNLATMRNRGPEAVLTNVIAPNQEVNPQYVNYVVVTTDGRQLTGMIAAETATSVTLKRAENQTDTVLRIDIEELRGTGVSLMPEGMEKQIDKQSMADLLEYLKSVE
jgi:putative membrane-bound dehydrogenase-like protein